MLYLNLSRFELLLDPVPIELVSASYPLEPPLLEPLVKPLTSDSLFELLLDPVPIELVSAWYLLEPSLKPLTSDSLFVNSFCSILIAKFGAGSISAMTILESYR